MGDTNWIEVPAAIGVELWRVLRPRLGNDVSVYEALTDPEGCYGRPTVITAVGVKGGSAALLKCVSRKEPGEENWTEHHYYVPNGNVPEDE